MTSKKEKKEAEELLDLMHGLLHTKDLNWTMYAVNLYLGHYSDKNPEVWRVGAEAYLYHARYYKPDRDRIYNIANKFMMEAYKVTKDTIPAELHETTGKMYMVHDMFRPVNNKAILFDSAREHFTQAIEKDDSFVMSHFYLGLLEERDGNTKEKIEHFKKVSLKLLEPVGHEEMTARSYIDTVLGIMGPDYN